jgi:hypothetical protein
MSILWKRSLVINALYFNKLQNPWAEGFWIIRFLEGGIQLSKAQIALRIAG